MSSKVPKAVQKQAERANQLHKEAYNPDTDKQAQVVDENEQLKQQQEQQQQQSPVPVTAAPGHDDDVAALRAENQRLQSSLKTLQGKYDAEVPRLTSELRQMKDQAKRREDDLEKANERAAQAEQALRDEFGDSVTENLSHMVGKHVRTAMQEERDASPPQSQPATEGMTKAEVDTAIFKAFPDFEAINKSPEWIAWLKETTDQATGMTMGELVNFSYRRLDAITVIRVVRDFQRAKAGESPHEHIATPRGNQNRQVVEEPEVSGADFQKHQRERVESKNFTKGPWAGKRAEWEAMERQIHAALQQHDATT